MQIADLPFSLYSTFVIEAQHGFNKVCSHFSKFSIYLLLAKKCLKFGNLQ
jgi:hypothetical protein